MLLLPTHNPGSALSIEDFYDIYFLSDNILSILIENSFKGSHTFEHIEVADLTEMGFLKGKIAEMKVAVCTWGTLHKA
jgi:hypothetical protein